MIHKGVVLAWAVVLLFIFSAITQAEEYSVDRVKGPRPCCEIGVGKRCLRLCDNVEEVSTLEAYKEAGERGEPQYSVDQTGGFHCCILGAFGNCWRWCLNDEKMATLGEGGGTRYSMDQYPGRRCCSWGPRNRCVRWC